LEPRIAQEERERPEFARTRPELPPSGYADELEHLTRELADAARERETTAIAVWETLARWQKEAPALQEELAAVEEGLQRALRRQKALEIALEELKGVAAAVHTEWASELNERGNRLLSAFLPSLRRLRFENDLSFHVVGCGDDQEVADPATLSMGQRDQLYLAVRLGIAGFVAGRSGGLPLILDDPFVNFDDERFCRALRFIAEQATSAGGKAVPAHQILLFTCHRERFAWLRRKDPDWFDRHIFQREIPQSLEGEGRRTEDEG
jgi:hypothetical protein